MSLEANRRSWVEEKDFMRLLCHQYFFKRFYHLYARFATAFPYYNTSVEVDVREFTYILKRCHIKLSEVEVEHWFEECGANELQKVPLAEACHIVTEKQFFR